MEKKIRLNLGCGGRPLHDYINVDMDTLEDLRRRYPNQEFSDDLVIEQFDIFNLPYEDNSVDEIRSDAMVVHLPFTDEPKFFFEVERVLKPGGLLYISTVDFEETVKLWLKAEDDWKDFYRDDDEAISQQHWFGTYTYGHENRWGHLVAIIYGAQNSPGMFHTNCYTEGKLRAIANRLNLKVTKFEKFLWKGDRDPMIGITLTK